MRKGLRNLSDKINQINSYCELNDFVIKKIINNFKKSGKEKEIVKRFESKEFFYHVVRFEGNESTPNENELKVILFDNHEDIILKKFAI